MKLILWNSIKKSKYYGNDLIFFKKKNFLEVNYFYWFENKLYLKTSNGGCLKVKKVNMFPTF